MTITTPTIIGSAIRQLDQYKVLTEKAQAARADPNASAECRESQYEKYRGQARALAADNVTGYYLGTAQRAYDRERAKVDGVLQADPARISMAWQAMQPLWIPA